MLDHFTTTTEAAAAWEAIYGDEPRDDRPTEAELAEDPYLEAALAEAEWAEMVEDLPGFTIDPADFDRTPNLPTDTDHPF